MKGYFARRVAWLLAGLLVMLCGCGSRQMESERSQEEPSHSQHSAVSSLPQTVSSLPEPSSTPEPQAASETTDQPPEPEASGSQAAEESRTAAPAQPPPQPEPEPQSPDSGDLPPEVAALMVDSSWSVAAPVALEDLVCLNLPYVDFDGVERVGEMIVHHSLAAEVEEIFAELMEGGFPIAGMALIDHYGANDFASMEANNSYCFCARTIAGTSRWSVHSYGSAIDLNPVQNPYCLGESVYPSGAADYLDREDVRPGMIVEGDLCYNAFTSRGWTWGGHWPSPDYQHFQKDIDAG